jgi:glutamate-1-semialdehyde aminotransferase
VSNGVPVHSRYSSDPTIIDRTHDASLVEATGNRVVPGDYINGDRGMGLGYRRRMDG